ncbi:MAG: hypothetical protein AABW49_00850 [Nanoarchaeota archaeon]
MELLKVVVMIAIIAVILALIGWYIFFRKTRSKDVMRWLYISLCPNCGDSSKNSEILWGHQFARPVKRCVRCKYEGIFVDVDLNQVEDFQKNLKHGIKI